MSALSPAAELLLRNQSSIKGQVLLAHLSVTEGIGNFIHPLLTDDVEALHLLMDDWRSYQSMVDFAQRESRFLPLFQAYLGQDNEAGLLNGYDNIVLFMPKAKEQARYLIAQLLPLLKSGACFWLVGENNGGIKSADKLVRAAAEEAWPEGGFSLSKADKAKKSTLLKLELGPVNQIETEYSFNPDPWELHWNLPENDAFPEVLSDLKLISLPGVFSHGRLDEGTALMLQNMPRIKPSKVRNRRVLDMGCGTGVIGLSLLKRDPELEVTFCDVNAMALEATSRSLKANDLEGEVFASDMWSDVTERFDLIISNPPFHTGQKTDYDLADRFIRQAKKHLKRSGELRIVANRFLKYPDIIEATFGHCERIAETGKFCIWSARI
ncbi:methyltransferase [Oceanospirillum sanctuarii]|uniref:methyltransferase n=1 Tax=Oceanospirillum sanctuarii TaxID=1434821 RepID=UPI000A361583|nr:methyltransferase [Oceanospirillum sanctuarii]